MTETTRDPRLDPELAALLTFLDAADAPPPSEQTPAQARRAMRTLSVDMRDPALLPAMAEVSDRTVPGPAGEIPVRIYRPEQSGPLPTVVFLHGGGFVIGDLDTHDLSARTVADLADAVVVSVDYRLAPEHRFPAAVEDAIAAAEWVADHATELGGSARVGLAGDSAGGNLSAVVAQHFRDAGRELAAQLLIYPITDHGGHPDRYPSLAENAEGYFLDAPSMRWFGAQYVGVGADRHGDVTDPRLSPIRGDLHGLAPAVVVTAQFDPLRDDGAAYAAALSAAGVPARHRLFDGQIHGFFDMGRHSKATAQAVEETCALFRELLHG